jgi:hypothetical protein
MTRHVAFVLALASLTCTKMEAGSLKVDAGGLDRSGTGAAGASGGNTGTGGNLQDAGTIATGGSGNPGTGGGLGGTAGDAGTGGGGDSSPDARPCTCAYETPDGGSFPFPITSSWDCFCASLPNVCGERLDQYLALVRIGGGSCYQIREYATCGLTRVFRRVVLVPDPGGSRVFDQNTGQLVGVDFGSDTSIRCPTDPQAPQAFSTVSLFYQSGRLPGSDCTQTSCTGTCVSMNGLPSQTEQPCPP